jgi:hypothetical protein
VPSVPNVGGLNRPTAPVSPPSISRPSVPSVPNVGGLSRPSIGSFGGAGLSRPAAPSLPSPPNIGGGSRGGVRR